jgi:CheY-like chemotaxis protein
LETKTLISHAWIAEDDDDDYEIFSSAVGEISVAIILTRSENGELLMKELKAIEKLPDILFLDILMPRVDGKECLKMIRSEKKIRHASGYHVFKFIRLRFC